jgi:hypothetical protein
LELEQLNRSEEEAQKRQPQLAQAVIGNQHLLASTITIVLFHLLYLMSLNLLLAPIFPRDNRQYQYIAKISKSRGLLLKITKKTELKICIHIRLPHHHQYCSSPFTSVNELSTSSPLLLASSSSISVNNDAIANQQQQTNMRLTPPPHSQQQQQSAFLLELSPSAQRRKGREPRSIRQRLDTSLAAAASAMNEQMPLEHLEHTVCSLLLTHSHKI